MRRQLMGWTLALSCIASAQAAEKVIDLDCEQHSERLVQRVIDEMVVALTEAQAGRIQQISLELCGGAETVAAKQQQEQQEKVLKNWFFSDQTGGKAGNERLKKLK